MKNAKIMIFEKETQTVRVEKLKYNHNDTIESKHDLYHKDNTIKYFDDMTGTLYFLVNVDLPAKQEAEKLQTLRRSTAINNLFNYDVKKPFNLMSYMPYIIILALILFM